MVAALILLDLFAVMAFWGATSRLATAGEIGGGMGVVFFSDYRDDRARRVDKAVALLENDVVDRVMTVSGNAPIDGEVGAVDMALLMIMRGVQDQAVYADGRSSETVSGVRSAVKHAAATDEKRIVFISECMHILRVRAVASRELPANIAPAFVCVEREAGDVWGAVRLAHHEFGAWILYALPHDWAEGLRAVAKGRPAEAGGG